MFGINVEYKKEGAFRFPEFTQNIKGKSVLAVADINTEKYLKGLLDEIKGELKAVDVLIFPDEELVPDESAYNKMEELAKGKDWILVAGSGTLNDLGKYVGSKLGIKNSTLATMCIINITTNIHIRSISKIISAFVIKSSISYSSVFLLRQ